MFVTQLKQYINRENKIPIILEALNCGKIKTHDDYVSSTFGSEGDNVNGVNISRNDYLSFCSWSRNIMYSDGKDLIHLVELLRHCDFITALKWIHEVLGLEYSIKDMHTKPKHTDLKAKALSVFTNHLSYNAPVNVANLNILDESVLGEYINIEHIDLLHEGITPRTCRKFNIEYSYKRKRIMIPHRYWLTGELLGFNGRTTLENYEDFGVSKYFISKGFNKNINLYGLWENYKGIKHKGMVVVMESEKSVLKRHSLFDETCVALSGKTLSEEQKRILIGLDVEIVIALDNDVNKYEVYSMCEKFFGVRPISFIKDANNVLENKDSPADACDDDYMDMLKHRIKYTKELHNEYLREISK